VNAGRAGTIVSDQPLPGAMRRQLERIKGVKGAYPWRLALTERRGRQMMVYAIPVAEAARAGDWITAGPGIPSRDFVALLARGEVALSRLAAKQERLTVGDSTALAATQSPADLRIGGFFNDISSFASMYIERSRYVALTGDTRADRFAVTLEPGVRPGLVHRRLRTVLDQRGSYASVQDRAGTKHNVTESIEGMFSIAKGVQAAGLLVSLLVVLNLMLTVTFERRFEFGVARLLGMSRRQLSLSVVLEAVAVALIGALAALIAGLMLGLLMTAAIEARLAWDIAFSPATGMIMAPLLVIVAAGALAALYPSLLATRLSIAALVRSE
jgi:putative ABC transport system permease protein